MLAFGCLAFVLFFLSDMNDVRLKKKALTVCFPLGAVLLAISTAVSCIRSASPFPIAVKLIASGLGVLFFLLLIDALFFSVSADEAYIERKEGRSVSTKGPYALCRHPGVLFFIPTYLCLSFAFGLPFYETAVYSLLNILLIVYEDLRVFPKVLSGYTEYKKTTPFLIPSGKSIKNYIGSCKKRFSDLRRKGKQNFSDQ